VIFPSVAATATVAVVSAPSGRFALPCQLLADENHTAAEAADGKHDESNDTGPNCHGCFADSVISVWIDLSYGVLLRQSLHLVAKLLPNLILSCLVQVNRKEATVH